ncbi:MAG TPA: choice-of-anchor tandem repeat GloVer-containing protein, partial [Nocardioidaceae bacterium]
MRFRVAAAWLVRCATGFAVFVASSRGARAQTYEVLHDFTGTNGDGAIPYGTLVQVGSDFYGTTRSGGTTALCTAGCGTIFKLDSGGHVTTVYSFDADTDDGLTPIAGLTLATDGNLYGTTPVGGATANAAVYRFEPGTGLVTTIDSFDRDTGGWFGSTNAMEGTDGQLYVATTYGHCGDDTDNCPQVLRMTLSGSATPFHTFDPEAEGSMPLSPLLQTSPGDFYGTTTGGNGAVFHLNAAGEWTLVHGFNDTDGRVPMGNLVRDGAGNIYGVTAFGTESNLGTIYRIAA